MPGFTSVHDDRLHVHVFPTDRFKTHHLQLKMTLPLERKSVTATAILPYLWMEGTTKHPSAQQLMRESDELYGVAIRSGIGKRGDLQVAEVYASVPDESALGVKGVFAKAQQLALEIAISPLLENGAFPKRHVDRAHALHRRRIASLFDDKISWAMDRCMKSVYEGERFGLPRLGYLEDLDSLDGTALAAAHQWMLANAQIHLYVIGSWTDPQGAATAVLDDLRKVFPSKRGTKSTAVTALEPRIGEVRRITEEQKIRQGKLDLGFRTGVSYADADYPAMMVYNGTLGGFPHAKLFVNVREKASLAYYASSRLDGLTGVLAVQTGIEVNEFERAQEIILKQVEALKAGQISEDELTFTKRGLCNQYLQANDQPMAIIDMHFAGILAGKPRALHDLIADVNAVTMEEVVDVAQKVQLDTVYFLRSEVNGDA